MPTVIGLAARLIIATILQKLGHNKIRDANTSGKTGEAIIFFGSIILLKPPWQRIEL